MQERPLILIADDDAQIRGAISVRLRQAEFAVVSAACAKDAMEVFDHCFPDAVVLDVNMPDNDGFAVCEHIRRRGSDVPVLFLTAAQQGAVRNHLPALTETVGANRFLTKPYDGKVLAMMLRELLRMPPTERPTCTHTV